MKITLIYLLLINLVYCAPIKNDIFLDDEIISPTSSGLPLTVTTFR